MLDTSQPPMLAARLHPAATRVELLASQTPAIIVAFDLLAVAGDDLRDRPFAERRARLEALVKDATAPVFLTPATHDRALATRWLRDLAVAGWTACGEAARGPPTPTSISVRSIRTELWTAAIPA